MEQDSDGVRLFSRRAPCAPDSQPPVCPSPRTNQFRKDLPLQEIENSLVPEKVCFPDSQMGRQHFNLVHRQRRGQQPLDARVGIVKAKLPAGSSDTPSKVSPSLWGVMKADLSPEELTEAGK